MWENKAHTSFNYLIYHTWAWNFVFRKLEFDTIYHAYLNESPFKYYISILGGVGGLRPCLLCLFGGGVQNSGKPAYIILAHSLWSKTHYRLSLVRYDFCNLLDASPQSPLKKYLEHLWDILKSHLRGVFLKAFVTHVIYYYQLTYEYKRQGPAPRVFFGQNCN